MSYFYFKSDMAGNYIWDYMVIYLDEYLIIK